MSKTALTGTPDLPEHSGDVRDAVFAAGRHVRRVRPLLRAVRLHVVGDGVQQPAVAVVLADERLLVEHAFEGVRIPQLGLLPEPSDHVRRRFADDVDVPLPPDSQDAEVSPRTLEKTAQDVRAVRGHDQLTPDLLRERLAQVTHLGRMQERLRFVHEHDVAGGDDGLEQHSGIALHAVALFVQEGLGPHRVDILVAHPVDHSVARRNLADMDRQCRAPAEVEHDVHSEGAPEQPADSSHQLCIVVQDVLGLRFRVPPRNAFLHLANGKAPAGRYGPDESRRQSAQEVVHVPLADVTLVKFPVVVAVHLSRQLCFALQEPAQVLRGPRLTQFHAANGLRACSGALGRQGLQFAKRERLTAVVRTHQDDRVLGLEDDPPAVGERHAR